MSAMLTNSAKEEFNDFNYWRPRVDSLNSESSLHLSE